MKLAALIASNVFAVLALYDCSQGDVESALCATTCWAICLGWLCNRMSK